MRYLILLSFLFWCGCKKQERDGGHGTQLVSIEAAGKTMQQFTYSNENLLLHEAVFNGCATNPSDEFTYTYSGTTLSTITAVTRSLYSSTSALCDPATGVRAHTVLAYDRQGRLQKATRDNGTTSTFYYNADGFVDKLVVSSGANSYTYRYDRDARGNITAATDAQGTTTYYAFDDKRNPYYNIKTRPDLITAFYNSPNNVVSVTTSNHTTTLQYQYNAAGLPVQMMDNGAVYTFVYQ